MAAHHDPTLLFELENVRAYIIRNGEETPLNTFGSQTLSLTMVPTSSSSADLYTSTTQSETSEIDFFLHLGVPPELDLSLPASTQIYPRPPRSYLIPQTDQDSENGCFFRIELPEKVSRESVDTFETILAQCTAFMERAAPPTGSSSTSPYNPAEWAAGGKFAGGKTAAGQLVLVDEDDGSIVGELAEGAHVVEDARLGKGSKEPVEIEISQDGQTVNVSPVSEDYLALSRMEAYRTSSLVQNAAMASRFIVTSSNKIGDVLVGGADSFTQKTTPNPKPMTFGPATHERIRKIHSFTDSGRNLSAKTVGMATKHAQNFGAMMARKNEERYKKGFGPDGKPVEGYKPGFLNKSMIAFTTIADGVAQGGKSLLNSSGTAATTVVGHRYGPQAGSITADLAGGVKNVGLVYIDVTGVTRRAVIKSVAKGMVVGRVKGGGQIVVGGGDGGAIPQSDTQQAAGGPPPYSSELGSSSKMAKGAQY